MVRRETKTMFDTMAMDRLQFETLKILLLRLDENGEDKIYIYLWENMPGIGAATQLVSSPQVKAWC